MFPTVNQINEDYIYQSTEIKSSEPQIVNLDEIVLLGYSIFVKDNSDGREISETWNIFFKEISNLKLSALPQRFYQVQFWSDTQELNGLYFFIGIEIKSFEYNLPNMTIKIIPPCKYLCFIHKGLANKVGYTYKYIYNNYLPNTNYVLNRPYNFEYYDENYKGPFNQQSESKIYIPVQ